MRKARALCLCLLALVLLSGLPALADGALEVYLIDPCGGCAGTGTVGCGQCKVEDELFLRYKALLRQVDQEARAIVLYNVRRVPEAYDALQARLLAQGEEGFALPVLYIDDHAFPADGSQDEAVLRYLRTGDYAGYGAMRTETARTIAERPARSILYLSSAYCEDCKKVEAWLARALPYDIEVRKYDIGAEAGMLMERAVHAHYGTDPDAFYVPLIVYGDDVLVGREQIYLSLLSRIEEFPDAVTPAEDVLLAALEDAP